MGRPRAALASQNTRYSALFQWVTIGYTPKLAFLSKLAKLPSTQQPERITRRCQPTPPWNRDAKPQFNRVTSWQNSGS